MRYIVLKISSCYGKFEVEVSKLEEKINEKIKDGWKLQGGVSIMEQSSHGCTWTTLAQAMVKED